MQVYDLIMKQCYSDKMPKIIKVNNCLYEYDDEKRIYIDYQGFTMTIDFTDNVLNMDVEIIEEDKTIEELEFDSEEKYIKTITGTTNKMRNIDVTLASKINELVKEIKKLKEN